MSRFDHPPSFPDEPSQDGGRLDEDRASGADHEAMLRRLLAELAEGRERSPDLTDAVMGRLGFVRCTPEERRRADRARAMRRAAVVALMMLAALAGYGIASRREAPRDQAIAPAVGGVLERHGRSIDGVMRGMPRWREPVAASPASLQVPTGSFGTIPVIFIPAHAGPAEGKGCPPRRCFDDAEAAQCPKMRRLAAQTPFPEA